MSVIVALISIRDGVVASDGRMFGSARLENGRVATPAQVATETFDKTFALAGGKVLGAFSGLMRFSGKTVADHAAEIADALAAQERDLDAIVTRFVTEMSARLKSIDKDEVIPPCRKLDVLLVGGAQLTRAHMRIVSLRFFPDRDRIATDSETVAADRRNRYYVRGEDKAAAAAGRILGANRAPNSDVSFLKRLAQQAVQVGIKEAGIHPHGTEKACGGQTYCRRTWYK
jgi:hypothetical protein